MVKPPKKTAKVEWIANLYKVYKSKVTERYLRGLHYWIISTARTTWTDHRGNTRHYENTLNEYKSLSRIVVDARLLGLIPFGELIDKRNDPLERTVYTREEVFLRSISMDSNGNFDITMDEMRKFEEFIKEVEMSINYPQFHHQTHRLALLSEKSMAQNMIKRLCNKYGVDYLLFGGQHSLTRLNELCNLAKDEEKPLLIFYLHDLDVAGWKMPITAMERIQQIYPHDDHKVVRIALKRDQIDMIDELTRQMVDSDHTETPSSFEPDLKKYSDKEVKDFITETGGSACIEVDAIHERVLMYLIEEQFKKYANLDEDRKLYNDTKKRNVDAIKELTENELVNRKDEYIELQKKFNKLLSKLNEIAEGVISELQSLDTKRFELVDSFETQIYDKLKELEKDEQEQEADQEEQEEEEEEN